LPIRAWASGKFDYPVTKDKNFGALDNVWTSSVGEVKDRFTLKVFKRLKPTPARLIDMLTKPDSEDATEYCSKKTKKPAVSFSVSYSIKLR
jgi:hypothetical protein